MSRSIYIIKIIKKLKFKMIFLQFLIYRFNYCRIIFSSFVTFYIVLCSLNVPTSFIINIGF